MIGVSGEAVSVPPQEPYVYTMELHVLRPLMGDTQTTLLPDGLPPGSYRLASTVEVRGQPHNVQTPPFTVE